MNAKFFSRSMMILIAAVALVMAGCSGGSGSSFSSSGTGNSNGTVSMMVSDAPENDWAAIDVKITSISLNPQGGGTPVVVYTAPSGTLINLVELDQLNEILGNASVPAGTYTSATLTLSANPGDVMLTASDDPDTGFAGTAGATVPSGQVQIQGASGSAGSKTVPLNITFDSPLVVVANQASPLDLEFDLSHPAFIIAHVPPASGTVEWAVNFNGPVHHHPIRDITRLVMRDVYGSFDSVSADNTSMTITKVYPVEPPTNPETAITSTTMLTVLADATNDTLFYNLDVTPVTAVPLTNFSSLATLLTGKFVRVAARYQVNGSLTGVRIWASSSFDKIWQNPEGHVLHVNTTANTLTVEKENGAHIDLQVTSATQFYFRTPGNVQTDDNAIGSGTGFLVNLKRGFKVHVLANPLTTPPTAVTVDIEIARFDGSITNATTTGFDYTRVFPTATDTYTAFPLLFINSSTANGNDPLTGAAILGFKFWNFAFPTKVTSDVTDVSTVQTINDFDTLANGSVNFGGSVGGLTAYGETSAVWGNAANLNGWSAPSAVLIPTPVPLGTVATAYSNSTGTFTMNAFGGSTPATVDVNATSGSATLVYQVDRNGSGIVTVSPIDITSSTGLTTFENAMVNGTLVKAAGLPESNGHIKAYVIFYFTGVVTPAS
jgi:hypothetical protein